MPALRSVIPGPFQEIMSCLAVLALVPVAAGAATAPSGQPAAHAAAYREGEVIVRFAPGVSEGQRGEFAVEHRLTSAREYPLIRCWVMRLAAGGSVEEALRTLKGDPRVDLVQPNFIYRADACPQDPDLVDIPAAENQWGVFATFLPSLWRATGGGGSQVIAILDTGIDLGHTEFVGRLLPGYDFVNDDDDPSDDHPESHGTSVAGVAVAAADGAGIVGIAYEGVILPVKVLDATGGGTSANVAAGINYAATHGATVINMSLSGTADDCLVRESVAQAYTTGVVLIAAAGNRGSSVVGFPARCEEVIAVGAVQSAPPSPGVGMWAESNHGRDLDVVAPGVAVRSTIRGGGYAVRPPGTSMASPFVTGVAALLLSEFPGMKAWELEAFLRRQTRNVDGRDPGETGNLDGYGLVSFGTLKDWSDAAAPAGEAWSENAFFEWLGSDVTGESAFDDLGAGDDAIPDLDGVTNASGDDGGDDGLFPASHARLPFLPRHLAELDGPDFLDVDLGVCDHAGRRYAGGENLVIRSWADWNSDGVFDPGEKMLDALSWPNTWPSDSKREVNLPMITSTEMHFRGNPLRVRTRATYGPRDSDPQPDGGQAFGEIEDQEVVNFIETFDGGAPYFTSLVGDWYIQEDRGWHHDEGNTLGARWLWGQGHVHDEAYFPELGTAPIDLTEVTHARLKLWLSHCVMALGTPCEEGDNCRISVVRIDPDGGATEVIPLLQLPMFCGPYGCEVFPGDQYFDLSGFAGYLIRILVEHDKNGGDQVAEYLSVDDVVVWGYDRESPRAAAWTGAWQAADRRLSLAWDHPDENTAAGGDNQAATYAARLAPAGGAFDWAGAFRLTPRDFAGGGSTHPVPGPAGEEATATILAPTTFPDLTVAMRGDDEVANPGAVGTTTAGITPTFAIAVVPPADTVRAAPGDTVKVGFVSANQSAALDAIAYQLSDTQGWIQCPLQWTHVLGPGAGAVDSVAVAVPETAAPGTTDRLILAARSLSDPGAAVTVLAFFVVGGPEPPCSHLADHDAGNLRFSVSDQGTLGFLSDAGGAGSGFIYPRTGGTNRLYIGGFTAATDPGYVLNRDHSYNPVQDWQPAGCLEPGPAGEWAESWTGTYTDAGHPAPRGLEIRQTSYAWSDAAHDDFVIILYEAVNRGTSTISDLWLGSYMDWDIDAGAGFDRNSGMVDADRRLIHMWREDGGDGVHVGVKALFPLTAAPSSFVHNPTYVYPLHYLTDADRYHFLTGDDPQYVVPATTAPDDWSAMLGLGPMVLAPGDTARAAVAVVAGEALGALLANADAAQLKFGAVWGAALAVAPHAGPAGAPAQLALGASNPNPFATGTSLGFELPAGEAVTLVVYDVAGRRVATLVDGVLAPGRHVRRWDGTDDAGRAAPSGVYYLRLEAAGETRAQKLLKIR